MTKGLNKKGEFSLIKWFYEIKETDLDDVGTKAFNLGKMFNKGVKVPNGFVITSGAYEEYIDRNGLEDKIEIILKRNDSTKEKSLFIKELFKIDLFSDELKRSLLEAWAKISGGRAAVRSSSTVEDLPGMSFAGQYSSYLNVTEKDLIEKVIFCWQSLWNERAMEYRSKNKITSKFSIGVIVQEMIDSKLSGVVFTANPLTGVRNQLLVNASYGLGEAIVSGKVNPDQYIIEMTSDNRYDIKEEITSKEVLCQYAGDGITYVPVDDSQKRLSSLGPSHIESLVKEAIKMEDHFGGPQDIEFAFDDQDELYIVQSREITSLFPIENFKKDGKLRAYLCVNTVMLGMKEPFTPIGFDMFSQALPIMIKVMTSRKKPLDTSFIQPAGGRIFAEISILLSKKFIAKRFGKSFAQNDLPLKDTMNRMIEEHDREFRHQGILLKIPFLGILKYGFSLMRYYLSSVRKLAPEELYDGVKALGEAAFQDYKVRASNLESPEEMIEFLELIMLELFKTSQKQSLYCMDINSLPRIEKRLKKIFGGEFDISHLTQSFPGCITVEMNIELNHLAKYFDLEQIEPTKDHPKVKEFLATFGHRCTRELDIGIKRWSEDPDYIMSMIKSYMVDRMYERNIADLSEKKEKAEQLIDEIYQKVKEEKGVRRARKIREQIINYRIAAGIREYPKFDVVRMLAIARGVILDLGEIYQANGLIDEAEDISYLRIGDIISKQISKQGIKEIVIQNKEIYGRELSRTTIPRIVLNTGETYYSARKIDPSCKVLQGMPLSAGIYEGRVRIVIDPDTSELKEGEILVTESTSPTWTPLFVTAKGLIMEYGGPISHGGIVAREYGIPAVVGISLATEVLTDGQMVRINGETGTVEILD